jgi:leucyl-tRNA---protein transferase
MLQGMSSSYPGECCPYPAASPPVPVPLVTTGMQPCPYLPDRQATLRVFRTDQMDGELYHRFMDASFRRSGLLIYQPVCRGCRACVPIRLAVSEFRPDKSQRRCWRQNQDLHVEIAPAVATQEKFQLYQRYQADWHHKEPGSETFEGFEEFLYFSPVQTVEFCYRLASGQLLAVGICDICAQSLSSVYFFFDPREARRGLGTFGVLQELDWARQRNIRFYYMGYWVRNSPAMSYKINFGPHQLLNADNRWQ